MYAWVARRDQAFAGQYGALPSGSKRGKRLMGGWNRWRAWLVERGRRNRAAWALAALTLTAGALWQLTAPNGDLFQYRCFALAFWRGSAGIPHAAGCGGRLPAGVYPAFHVLPREYPPLAIFPFSAPLLLDGLINLTLYVIAFNLLMALCLGATAWLIERIGARLGADAPNVRLAQRLYLLWLALGATTIALVRFDALPALLTVAALALALCPASGAKWAVWPRYAAYALLAAGALLKLYPALFIPLLAAWDWRREHLLRTKSRRGELASLETTNTGISRARRWVWLGGPLLALGIAASVQGTADLIAGASGVSWLGVQGRRPPQIESTAAGLLWLWQVAIGRGNAIHAVSVERSASFVEAPGRALATMTLALALLAIAWAFVAIAAGALAPLRGIAGATLALLGGASIFSPQYLVWVIPLVALALLAPGPSSGIGSAGGAPVVANATTQDRRRRRGRSVARSGSALAHSVQSNTPLTLLWSGVCVCTTIIYSVGYLLGWPAHTGGVLAGFMLLVLARDGLVWACAGLLLWPAARRPGRTFRAPLDETAFLNDTKK